MIASTFWKKTIHGAISCDQSTRFDSSSCSRKLPDVWKNFFGTIGARRVAAARGEKLLGEGGGAELRVRERRALVGVVRAAVLEVPAHRRHVEPDDLLA